MGWMLEQKKKLAHELRQVAADASMKDLMLAVGYLMVKIIDLEKEIEEKERQSDWLHEAVIAAEDANDEKSTQEAALGRGAWA